MNDSQTFVKQPYVVEADATLYDSNGTPEVVNISRINHVGVTSGNVNEVFGTLQDDTQIPNGQIKQEDDYSVVSKYMDLASNLTTDLFINEILSHTRSDADSLCDIRLILYEAVKNIDDYPFDLNTELKKRKKMRRGDSIELKLARDIHTISLVLDGAEYSDLKSILNERNISPINDTTLNSTFMSNNADFEIRWKKIMQICFQ